MTNSKIVGVVPGFNEESFFLDKTYLKFAEGPMEGRAKILYDLGDIKLCDAILLTGGRDINPTLFNMDNYASRKVNTDMDLFHIHAIEEAVSGGKEIFGICRGFQLLYYHFLSKPFVSILEYEQHLDGHNQGNSEVPRQALYHRVWNRHAEMKFTNSMHHQAVIGPIGVEGLPFVTWVTDYCAPKNKLVIEGITFVVGSSLISGVQWHPEELNITPEEYYSYSDGATSLPI